MYLWMPIAFHSRFSLAHLLVVISIALTNTSCQTIQRQLGQRQPASPGSNEDSKELGSLYESQLQIELLKVHLSNEKAPERLSALRRQLETVTDQFRRQRDALETRLELPDGEDGSAPSTRTLNFSKPWRTQQDRLMIRDLDLYSYTGARPRATYVMATSRAKEYWLDLQQEIHSQRQNADPAFSHQKARDEGAPAVTESLQAHLKCDGRFEVKQLKTRSYSAGEVARFDLYDRLLNSLHTLISPDSSVRECELTFFDPASPNRVFGVRLLTDHEADQRFSNLTQTVDVCYLPQAKLEGSNLSAPQSFFLTSNYLSMTCPTQIESIQTLEDPEGGVRAKAEALLGQPLPKDFVARQNPFAKLDFSKAPKLDIILASYLVFKSDFYGQLIARLMKFHADRGTTVRILVTDVIQFSKDRDMLYQLEASSPNVKLREYRFERKSGGGDFIDQFHRTMHVKLLVTYSTTDPSNDLVFVGGRNLHDGFVFKKAPDHSRLPKLVDYAGGEESFVHWRDFESAIRSKEFAEQIIAHFFALWEQDAKTFLVRSLNLNLSTRKAASADYFKRSEQAPLVRHNISVPYKDGESLKDFYAEMIDTAKKKLLISTPYFRPTKTVGDALRRAVKRGVDVTLITRIDLEGDTADFILSDVNKDGINEFYKKIKVYEYIEKKVILHSKLVMIDDELSYIGSVNLNKRSFYHDLENGTLIYSSAYTKKLEGIYESYRKASRRVTEKQRINFFNGILIDVLDKEL